MTKQVQRRRGTATQHTSFTGAEGELSVNTTNKSVHVHDNVTAGGFEAARVDMDNVTSSSILTAAGITATTTELNYVDGVTSAIQTQIDGKAGTASPTFTGTLTAANLTATGTTTLAGASTSADITFGDNDKAVFGAGSDLTIFSDGGTFSYINNTQGVLRIRNTSDDKDVIIQSDNGSGGVTDYFTADGSTGAAIMYNYGSQKLATTSTGISVTGNATFADNGKAIFGAGSDLQIYHTGSASYIEDVGTGGLIIRSDGASITHQVSSKNSIRAVANGEVELYHNNALKMETTSTGVDITGTLTATDLILDGGTSSSVFLQDSTATNGYQLRANVSSSVDGGLLIEDLSGKNIARFDQNNSISFYEDTGTTPKFFWSAADESLGIGKTNRTNVSVLTVQNVSDVTTNTAEFYNDNGNRTFRFAQDTSGNADLLLEKNDGTDTVLISTHGDSYFNGGNVGIGASIPTVLLDLEGTSPIIRLTDSDASGTPECQISGAGGDLIFDADRDNEKASSLMSFKVDGSEAMRISGGNLLVGKTAQSIGTDGVTIVNGQITATSDGADAIRLNRKTSDGSIIDLRKNGTTVGSIGINGRPTFVSDNGSSGSGIYLGVNVLLPTNRLASLSDNTNDLGQNNVRWDDIYATNGTINTSDRNEKQDIEVLSDAEQRVAVAAKGLLRKFRWKDAVAEKGDEARTHFGIIAQDLQAAFAAEGLDAGDYAMFISSTWTDEETGEERTRMGVRYSELLAFIVAAI